MGGVEAEFRVFFLVHVLSVQNLERLVKANFKIRAGTADIIAAKRINCVQRGLGGCPNGIRLELLDVRFNSRHQIGQIGHRGIAVYAVHTAVEEIHFGNDGYAVIGLQIYGSLHTFDSLVVEFLLICHTRTSFEVKIQKFIHDTPQQRLPYATAYLAL